MTLSTNEIRKRFLDFFASKNHTIVHSDSLVPKNDKTVLFTTAGMQQFKQQFLGSIENYKCAATSQKCLRTDDLKEVGSTDFHHTFFEMLGNFSFGDYFKKEAITWAWEFLTKELLISEKRLWVSVYHEDFEAENIWKDEIGIPSEKIFKLGDKSNFWPSNAKVNGPNGPCGPCSEIFFDYNPEDDRIPSDPDDIPGRFSEVWNLVFTQFERRDGGQLIPLPNKNIDTGMGLERLAAVKQNKKNNFQIDIFAPILKSIDENISPSLELKQKCIIADHLRAIVFGISDGVIPSNEGRGYVIKKLIIIASDIAQNNGVSGACIYRIVPSVEDAMQEAYPDISKSSSHISNIIKNIEKAYIKVRMVRIPELIEKYRSLKEKKYTFGKFSEALGALMFEYKDTYGLPFDTVIDIVDKKCALTAEEKDAAINKYEQLMKEQQERSRASSHMTGDVFKNESIKLNAPKTNFIGYNRVKSTSTILAIYADDKQVTNAHKNNNVKIILDKTPFYAESGGQIGDTGTITTDKGTVKVTDTQEISDIFIHIGKITEGIIEINDQVTAEVDMERRLSIMRNHTATHLLQSALREILGPHVQQQGSYVSEDRLRFDFTHHKSLTDDQLKKIELHINAWLLTCETVTKEFLSLKEAKHRGALAFFEEKYGNTVRVVSIGNYSQEFCGGTHLDSVGQIGFFKIISDSAIAQGIRRIEAKTGLNAFMLICQQEQMLKKIAKILKSPLSEICDKAESQTTKIKILEKELEKYRFESLKSSISVLLSSSEKINDTLIICHCFEDIEMGLLRKICDFLKQKTKSAIITLGSKSENNASILISVSDDLIKKGIKANEIIKEITPLMEGSGGGRPQLAQAGSKNTKKIGQAIEKAKDLIKGIIRI